MEISGKFIPGPMPAVAPKAGPGKVESSESVPQDGLVRSEAPESFSLFKGLNISKIPTPDGSIEAVGPHSSSEEVTNNLSLSEADPGPTPTARTDSPNAYYAPIAKSLDFSSGDAGSRLRSYEPKGDSMPNAYFDSEAKRPNFHAGDVGSHLGVYQGAAGEAGWDFRAHTDADVISKLTGHAILDSLRPGYLEKLSPDVSQFHDGFADSVAQATILADDRVLDKVVAQTGGDLSLPNSATEGLDGRNPWTRTMQSVLRGLAKENLAAGMDPKSALKEASQESFKILSRTVQNGPTGNFTHQDMANAFLSTDQNENAGKNSSLLRQAISENFGFTP